MIASLDQTKKKSFNTIKSPFVKIFEGREVERAESVGEPEAKTYIFHTLVVSGPLVIRQWRHHWVTLRDPMAEPDAKLSYGFRTPLWLQMHNWIKSSSNPRSRGYRGAVCVYSPDK